MLKAIQELSCEDVWEQLSDFPQEHFQCETPCRVYKMTTYKSSSVLLDKNFYDKRNTGIKL